MQRNKKDDWKPEYGWRPKPHPREAELEGMPRAISMGGIGNSRQYSPHMPDKETKR